MTSLMAGMRSWRPVLSSLLLFTYLPGCSSWHAGKPSPAEFVATSKPDRVRVTRGDGSTLVLTAPSVRDDTLFGTVPAGLARDDQARPVAIPLADVRVVEVKRGSAGNTIVIVGGVLLVLLVLGCATSSNAGKYYDPC